MEKTIIQLKKETATPVYLQFTHSFIREMKKGRIGPGINLPGTRQLSEPPDVHRKTVVRAYEELEAQAWIEKLPSMNEVEPSSLPAKGSPVEISSSLDDSR